MDGFDPHNMTPEQRNFMLAQVYDGYKTKSRDKYEMMGAGAAGAPTNNVGDGKIAGTVEAGDDPPVRKKKKYIYAGRGSRKNWMV